MLDSLSCSFTSISFLTNSKSHHYIMFYRRALDNIPPLSLCPASSERPKFLSKYVLQEVEKFVTDIAL